MNAGTGQKVCGGHPNPIPYLGLRFLFIGLKLASMLNFNLLCCLELVKKFVVVGGGGGVLI